jgi:predicted alpha/beta-hydrolase family hydrolase
MYSKMPVNQLEVVPFVDDTFGAPAVRGFLHKPAGPLNSGLVITHGAGGNCEAAILVSVARHFADEGFAVLRCDMPFRQARRYGPPFGSGAKDREGLQHAVSALRKVLNGRVFLGGHSYGGRQASMLAAEQHGTADGLVLLSYPLHPPRQPEKLRTDRFAQLETPALFVHGSRDAFGSREELESALRLIPAPTALVVIEGAGHDLGFTRGKHNGSDEVPKLIFEAGSKLFGFS